MTHDMSFVHHLTLTTGDLRRSYRNEVDASAIEHASELLADAVQAGGFIDLPVPGYRMFVSPFGERRAALITVHSGEHAVAAIGIAARPAPALWRALADLARRASPDLPLPGVPQAPWCTVVLLPDLLLHADAAAWLGDFERTMAWGWLA